MHTSFSKTTRLLVLLALTALPAGSQTTSLSDCPLDLGFVELQDRCARGDQDLSPETCTAVRLFERLARDDRATALGILDREIAYPPSHREHVMPWLDLLAKSALDPDGPEKCTKAQAETVFGIGPGLMQGEPKALVFLLRVFGWSEVLLERLEQQQPDRDATEATKKLGIAVRQILLSTEVGKTALDGLNESPFAGMLGGLVPAPPPAQAAGDEAMRRVDLAVRLAQEGDPDGMREAMSETLELADGPVEKARLMTRAGISLLVAELNEDSLVYLLQANKFLDGHVTNEPATRILNALTKYSLALAHRELGFSAQEARYLESAKSLVDGNMGELLQALGESFVNQDASQLTRLAEMVTSGKVSKDDLEPLMEVLSAVVPGLDFDYLESLTTSSGGSTGDTAYFPEMLQMMEHISMKRYDDAAAVAEQLIERFPSYNNVYFLAVIAGKQFLADDHEGALRNSRKAVDALESKVEVFRVEETQTAFVDHEAYLIFQLALEMAGQAHRVEEAFEYAERGRAWTLRRLLGSPRRTSVPEEPSAKEKDLLDAIHRLDTSLRTVPQDSTAALAEELTAKRDEFAELRMIRKLEAAEENALARVKPVTLDRLRSEIVPPETTLLIYAGGPDDLWAWVIDRESVEMVFLPVPEDRRTAEVTDAVRGVSHRGIRPGAAPVEGSLKELYSELIEPLAEHLRHENLIVVPYGVLHHLPFAALRNPSTGDYLVEKFTLSLAPSASALEQILRSDVAPGDGEPLILGDPVTELKALPGAREEAKAVADLLGAEPLLREQATKTAVLNHAENVGLLHLAAHGEYTSSHPIFSWIRLSSGDRRDDFVETHEVWDRWSLPKARLVVLSGCQTALGELTRGDEVLGLTQAFLIAGSRAVLSTLWSVDDEASQRLIVEFYRRLLNGMTAAQALGEAQRKLMQDYTDPFFWAGYTLTGDPQVRWRVAKPPVQEDGPPAQRETSIASAESASTSKRWPTVLTPALGMLVAGVVALGFFLPSRFPPRLGVVLSPEEDMDEGHCHRIRSAHRFFRPARVYVSSNRLQGQASGALARLRASRRGVRIQPMNGHSLWQQSGDGEWMPLPDREHRMRTRSIYRDERGTVFFRLRQS